KRFMDGEGLRVFEAFRSEKLPNISNVVRCRIIDELVEREIAAHPLTSIVSVGAGFDTRPYRLRGGEWYELDEPQLIDYKERQLPFTESPNPLRRYRVDFASGSLGERLLDIPVQGNVVVVIEGVFMYLSPDAIAATLRALRERFPRHVLLCDLMNRAF